MNYGMHPVIIGEAMGMNTDFPGFFSRCVESGCSGIAAAAPKFPVAMFLQAGGGDVNPGEVWTNNVALSQDYGRRLAQRAYDAIAVAGFLKSTNGMTVRSERTIHALTGVSSCNNLQGCPTEEARPVGTSVNWEPESTAVVVGTPPVGSTVGNPLFSLATVPGEPFTALQTSLHARAATGEVKTFLVGYANGYYGYFPNSEALNCTEQLVASPGQDCRNNSPLSCTPGAPSSGFGGFACYGVAACSSNGTSYSTGPTFFGHAIVPQQTAGEQFIEYALTSLNALIH
jgi:hypothetical protein